ncbi:Spo0E family sporulation regulatory protein-aspartic acid phosphatase [Carboxydothermus pertinax]
MRDIEEKRQMIYKIKPNEKEKLLEVSKKLDDLIVLFYKTKEKGN